MEQPAPLCFPAGFSTRIQGPRQDAARSMLRCRIPPGAPGTSNPNPLPAGYEFGLFCPVQARAPALQPVTRSDTRAAADSAGRHGGRRRSGRHRQARRRQASTSLSPVLPMRVCAVAVARAPHRTAAAAAAAAAGAALFAPADQAVYNAPHKQQQGRANQDGRKMNRHKSSFPARRAVGPAAACCRRLLPAGNISLFVRQPFRQPF